MTRPTPPLPSEEPDPGRRPDPGSSSSGQSAGADRADLTKTDPSTAARFATSAADRWLPGTIGRYRIVRLLGEGGMGAVYEAEQDQPRRTVALKVIKPGLASPELLRRFEQESQALGRLQHPGIAQIYEAGTADTGFGRSRTSPWSSSRGEPLRRLRRAASPRHARAARADGARSARRCTTRTSAASSIAT